VLGHLDVSNLRDASKPLQEVDKVRDLMREVTYERRVVAFTTCSAGGAILDAREQMKEPMTWKDFRKITWLYDKVAKQVGWPLPETIERIPA
jgi:hypothetical protein